VFPVVALSLAATLAFADDKKTRTARDIVDDYNKSMPMDEPPPPDLGPDPLGDIADKMTNVHADLSAYKTDKPVQEKQQNVVASLDVLIARLQPKGGIGGSNNPNGTGRRASTIVDGAAQIGDLHGVDPRGKQWGNLPPKERERILQSRTEGFPAGYESLLQSYYQRLAQEKATDTETPPAKP
jgi:hypothetical protein